MKVQLRNIKTGQIESYEDFDILVFTGDNNETLQLEEYLPDFVDQQVYLECQE